MSDASGSGLRARIPPNSELLAVEHPCYVVDAERGMQMLGGPLAIARASASNSDCLECYLRPNDPLSHPLFGVLAPTPGFLLKVTRRPAAATSAGDGASPGGNRQPEVTAEVVGTVASSYRFEGLADYQYVTSAAVRTALDARPRAAGEPFDLIESLRPLGSNVLSIPPALFSMHDTPLDYLPRSQKAGAQKTGGDAASGALLRTHGASQGAAGAGMAPGAALPPRRRRARPGRAVPMHFGQKVDFGSEASPAAPPEAIAKTVDPNDDLCARGPPRRLAPRRPRLRPPPSRRAA